MMPKPMAIHISDHMKYNILTIKFDEDAYMKRLRTLVCLGVCFYVPGLEISKKDASMGIERFAVEEMAPEILKKVEALPFFVSLEEANDEA